MTLRLPKAALALALPLFAVPAFAAPDAPSDAKPDETSEEAKQEQKALAEEKAEPKKICKRISAQAGSRRKTKVCRTREEWATFNQEQRRRN